jgi:TolA-binding protein
LPGAAASRLQQLLDTYPDYSRKDKVLYFLGLAQEKQEKTEEAAATFERLRTEYPDSPYVDDLPNNKG